MSTNTYFYQSESKTLSKVHDLKALNLSYFKKSTLEPYYNKEELDGNVFSDIVVKNLYGEDVLLSDIWKGRTVIIKVLRRLGCCLCKQEAKMLSDLQPLFEKHNVKMVAIAFEDIDLKAFLSFGYWKWDIYIDPQRSVYRAAGLEKVSFRYQLSLLVTRCLKRLRLLLKSKGMTNNLRGDTQQLGGTFVINPEGEIIYKFKPTKYAQFPSLKEIYALVGGDPDEIDENDEELPKEYIYTRERLSLSNSSRSSSLISNKRFKSNSSINHFSIKSNP